MAGPTKAPGAPSTVVPGGAAPRTQGPSGTTASMRRRPTASSRSSSGVTGGMGSGAGMLRFYTDDAPGLRITPVRHPHANPPAL